VDWGVHYPKFFGGSDAENHALCLNSKRKIRILLFIDKNS